MRLFVLAVLPSVGCGQERDGEPSWDLTALALMARENDLLAQKTQHLHRKRFVAHDEIEAALVAECGTRDRLFIESGDHGPVDRLGDAGFRSVHPVAKPVERAPHAVASKLVGIAQAHAQVRVGVDELHEPVIDHLHRRPRPTNPGRASWALAAPAARPDGCFPKGGAADCGL